MVVDVVLVIEGSDVTRGEVVVGCDVEDGEAIVEVSSDVLRGPAVVSVLVAVE